jgi:4-amino-4-deoxy-L-arabinose transferase-like glycosyltransferase
MNELPIRTFFNSRTGLAIIFLLLFLSAWLPRTMELDRFVTADEHRWITRSANFAYALHHGDLIHTYQREHPAVTTTWLGALGVVTAMPDYVTIAPGYFDAMVEDWGQWVRANTDVEPITMLAWGRIYTVLVVSLMLALTFFPLRRLFGTPAALLANLFVAWSPMAIAFSRQVQPDGLHSMFMYAALVFFLGWLYGRRRRRDLLASGILMGLGWLTKTPVLFLAPIGGVLLAVESWRETRQAGVRWFGPAARRLFVSYVMWGVIASATFFLLWPALWVDPIGIFGKMYSEMTEYIGGHSNPNFFMGQITHDPGPLFYPVAIFFRTTPAALIGLAALLVALLRRWPPAATATGRRAAWGLLLFALLFTLFMTLPAKKFDRYLMPTFLVLDAAGGLGWAALGMWAYRAVAQRVTRTWLAPAAATAVLAFGLLPLHGLLNVPHYPYYLTYYNPLAGGTRTAPSVMFVGWGEGLHEAGHWLDQQPEAEKKKAIGWYAMGPLSYFFHGEAEGILFGSRMPWLDVDYVVSYINQEQRNIPTKEAVDFFARQTPVFTSTISGMEMAKVYDMRAIVAELYAEVAEPVELPAGLQWPPMTLAALRTLPGAPAGSVLPVELGWDGPFDGTRRLSLRLIAADGTLVAQVDDGLEALNKIQIFVPPDATPGEYGLHLLLYDADSFEPIPAADGRQMIQVAAVQIGQD